VTWILLIILILKPVEIGFSPNKKSKYVGQYPPRPYDFERFKGEK
jgi:hypothetical protein